MSGRDVDPVLVKNIFFDALDQPETTVSVFLDTACGGDTALRAEVASLLAHHDETELLSTPASTPPPTPEVDPLWLVGEVLDARYRVDRFVAEGGFGFVYKAHHLRWDQPVAVKVFKPLDDPSKTEALQKAFYREGALLNKLSRKTTSIVQSYDVGTWANRDGLPLLFTVLEWLEGSPLSTAAPPPAGWTVDTLVARLDPVAQALSVAHADGVAHRDIKPENIFVVQEDDEDTMKVLDFGIAKVADSNEGFLATGTGIRAFSVKYCAPEQLEGLTTGPWTDVYAFAMVCVELLVGRHPYDDLSPLEAILEVGDPDRRPTPGSLGLTVPDAVEAVFARAFTLTRAERYPDAATFWAALVEAAAPH